MAQILIRDLDKKVVDRLKKHARENKRSLQGEAKAILEDAVRRTTPQELEKIWKKWREHWGERKFDDSAALIREGRDSR